MTTVRLLIVSAFFAFAFAFAFAGQALAQDAAHPVQTEAMQNHKLTPEEEQLVRGSRDSILRAGISPQYFDAHFRLERVVNLSGDRRVVWRFRVNEHEAMLNDAIGFYTDEKGRRVFTHSIGDLLATAHDIKKTITRRRAERLMRACIGPYDGGSVLYQARGVPPRASLVFNAMSLPKPEKPNAKTPPPPPPQEDVKGTPVPPQSDNIRQGGKRKPHLFVGSIDLETGRCIKGIARVGPPQPGTEKYYKPQP